jgi:carbonic anhydrase
MSVTNEYLRNNQAYAARFSDGHLAMPPSKQTAIVACMDARLMVSDALGVKNGEAHIIRNAGGIVNPETLRSLVISHKLLGTKEFIVINHTDCGMLTFRDEELLARLRQETGGPVDPIPFYSFTDVEQNVRWQVEKIKAYPYLPKSIPVRGFVYDVKTGKLHEIAAGA